MKRTAECKNSDQKKYKYETKFHFVVQCSNRDIRMFNTKCAEVSSFKDLCPPDGGIAMGENQEIFVADFHGNNITVLDSGGRWMNSLLCNGPPYSVHYDGVGKRLLVPILTHDEIQILGLSGQCLGCIRCVAKPHYAIVDRKNRIIVCNSSNIQALDEDGTELVRFGAKGRGAGKFDSITGLAVNRDNRILVCDYGNRKLNIFTEDFAALQIVSLNFNPWSVAVDPANNKIYMVSHGLDSIVIMGENGEEPSLQVKGPVGLSFAPEQRWSVWNPRRRPSQPSVASFVKAWCASVQCGEGSLALLPRDVAIHEIAQIVFNQ